MGLPFFCDKTFPPLSVTGQDDMNYLAHALLSPRNNELVQLGNLACDMLHPSEVPELDPEIREGIMRHQSIDRMTDAHSGFRLVRDELGSAGHPYAGVLTDILFDHYLASNWTNYSDEELAVFSNRVYEMLKRRSSLIPGRFSNMTMAIRKQNWFCSYATEKGLRKALDRLNYRSSRYIDPDQILFTERKIRNQAFPAFNDLMEDLLRAFGPDR